MQTSIRPLVLATLLALGASTAHAQATAPAAAPGATPINLSLAPAKPSAPPMSIDLAMLPASAQEPVASVQPAPIASPLLSASAELQGVARWVLETGDNGGLPYLLVDKANARVYAFNPAGQLQGTAPALLGLTRGDELLASNDTEVLSVLPNQRVTPAGRFVSKLAIDSHGKELLVIDYAASISLHAVVKGTPEERRAQRLNSPTSEDNRISYGCINVPEAFYTDYVSRGFHDTRGVVYILPETQPAAELFGFAPAAAEKTAGRSAANAGAAFGQTSGAR